MADKFFSIKMMMSNAPTAQRSIRLSEDSDSQFTVVVDDGQPIHIRLLSLERAAKYDHLIIEIEGSVRSIVLGKTSSADQTVTADMNGYHLRLASHSGSRPMRSIHGLDVDQNEIRAPSPSIVDEVMVAVGDILEANQPVLRLESMKVISTFSSPIPCCITEILAAEGETVETGALLVRFEPLLMTS